jgi:hypothetical protein
VNIPYLWILVSALVVTCVTFICARSLPTFRRHIRIIFPLLLLIGSISAISLYRSLAYESGSSTSPDGRFRVVVYRLPYFSPVPGSGGDCPAILRLFDNKGNQLASADLPMIQLAEVNWLPNHLEVHYFQFDLPPPSP